MTDGFQPSGTQSCNISIRSVRRVRPIRRRFHPDPARMSEISAARWEGQRGPGRRPSRAGLAAISIFPGRGKTCARPGQLLHAQTRYIPAPMHICEGCGRPASRLTDFTIFMLIRTAKGLGKYRKKQVFFCLAGSFPVLCGVCVVPPSPGRSRKKSHVVHVGSQPVSTRANRQKSRGVAPSEGRLTDCG